MAEAAAQVFLVVFTPVPLGLAGPVVLAFFAAVEPLTFFSRHHDLPNT